MNVQAQKPAGRLVIVVKSFPKLSETFILGEVRTLVENGLDPLVVSLYRPRDEPRQPGTQALDSRVVYLSDAFPSAVQGADGDTDTNADADDGIVDALTTLLERHDAGHVHVHYLSEPAEWVMRACQRLGIPYSVSAHAKDIYLSSPDALRPRIAAATFVTTCTRANLDYLRDIAGEQAGRCVLGYHGIDTDYFRPAAKPCDTPTLLATGRYKAKKGFDVLIDACADLARGDVRFDCDIIGYGEEDTRLQAQIDAHGLARKVRLCAPVDHVALLPRLQSATLFVMPCRQSADGDRDGIPNAMLEAMACGRAVITTPVSGIPEIVEHGVNGWLVPPDDPAALAVAIEHLLANPALRHTLGIAARSAIEAHFGWQENTRELRERLGQCGSQHTTPEVCHAH